MKSSEDMVFVTRYMINELIQIHQCFDVWSSVTV